MGFSLQLIPVHFNSIHATGDNVSAWETTWPGDDDHDDGDDCDGAAHDDDKTTNIGGPSHHKQSSFVSPVLLVLSTPNSK